MNNSPYYDGIYLWLARIGATIFVLLQQIILVDVAYNWNEDWIDRAVRSKLLIRFIRLFGLATFIFLVI